MSEPKQELEHPTTGETVQTYKGWSWAGFFLAGIWLAVKGFWKKLIGFLVVTAVLVGLIGPAVSPLMGLGLSVALGLKGNEWYEKKLVDEGYQPEDNSGADHESEDS